ncbi:MAG: DJ-1/PfpI family protein, partial [Ruminococcus sp.]|nr:DJ-1/PfpI family protein [Ruminococcus sp.]
VGVGKKSIVSSHGLTIEADISDTEIKLNDDLEAVVLPGGLKGTHNLEASEIVQGALDFAEKNGKYIAAICAAPTVPGHKGMLSGKKATCYKGFEDELMGAQYVNVPAVTDGKFITARGAGASLEFGYELIKALRSKEEADRIADQILWDM